MRTKPNKCVQRDYSPLQCYPRPFSSKRFPRIDLWKSLLANAKRDEEPLLVDMPNRAPSTKAGWWDIWTVGVAVNTRCITQGTIGQAYNLSEHSQDHYSPSKARPNQLPTTNYSFAIIRDFRMIYIRLGK